MKPQGFKKKNHGSCIFQVSFTLFHQLFHKLRRWQYVYTFSRYGACAGIKKILKIKKLTHKKASTSICKYKMHNIERVVHTSVLDIINKVNCHKVTVVWPQSVWNIQSKYEYICTVLKKNLKKRIWLHFHNVQLFFHNSLHNFIIF